MNYRYIIDQDNVVPTNITITTIAPHVVNIPINASIGFAASVSGQGNQSVTWGSGWSGSGVSGRRGGRPATKRQPRRAGRGRGLALRCCGGCCGGGLRRWEPSHSFFESLPASRAPLTQLAISRPDPFRQRHLLFSLVLPQKTNNNKKKKQASAATPPAARAEGLFAAAAVLGALAEAQARARARAIGPGPARLVQCLRTLASTPSWWRWGR